MVLKCVGHLHIRLIRFKLDLRVITIMAGSIFVLKRELSFKRTVVVDKIVNLISNTEQSRLHFPLIKKA